MRIPGKLLWLAHLNEQQFFAELPEDRMLGDIFCWRSLMRLLLYHLFDQRHACDVLHCRQTKQSTNSLHICECQHSRNSLLWGKQLAVLPSKLNTQKHTGEQDSIMHSAQSHNNFFNSPIVSTFDVFFLVSNITKRMLSFGQHIVDDASQCKHIACTILQMQRFCILEMRIIISTYINNRYVS